MKTIFILFLSLCCVVRGQTMFNNGGFVNLKASGTTSFTSVTNGGGGTFAPAFVQAAASEPSGSSTTLAFSSNNTAGNLIVVFSGELGGGGFDGSAITAITDTQGNTYTHVTTDNESGSFDPIADCWIASGIKSGANTLTVTIVGTGFGSLTALEYHGVSGVDTSSTGGGSMTTSHQTAILAWYYGFNQGQLSPTLNSVTWSERKYQSNGGDAGDWLNGGAGYSPGSYLPVKGGGTDSAIYVALK